MRRSSRTTFAVVTDVGKECVSGRKRESAPLNSPSTCKKCSGEQLRRHLPLRLHRPKNEDQVGEMTENSADPRSSSIAPPSQHEPSGQGMGSPPPLILLLFQRRLPSDLIRLTAGWCLPPLSDLLQIMCLTSRKVKHPVLRK